MLQRRIFRTACRVGGERVMGVVSSAAAKDGIFTLLLSGQGGPAFPRNGGLGPNVGIGGPTIKNGRTVAGFRSGCYLCGEIRPAQIHLLNNASARSEEHTSELQTPMRHSYAVFCFKKNTDKSSNTNYIQYKNTHK